MVKYIQTYCDYFSYGEQSFMPSEISGQLASDIHHIRGRGKGKDGIENLIALTREEHDRAHFLRKPYLYPEDLEEIHTNFLKNYEKTKELA